MPHVSPNGPISKVFQTFGDIRNSINHWCQPQRRMGKNWDRKFFYISVRDCWWGVVYTHIMIFYLMFALRWSKMILFFLLFLLDDGRIQIRIRIVIWSVPNYQCMALSAYQRMVAGGGGCWTGVGVLLYMCDNTIVQLYRNRPDPRVQRRSVLCSLVWWVHLDCHVGVAGPCLVLGYEALGAHHWKIWAAVSHLGKQAYHFLKPSKAVKKKKKNGMISGFSFWRWDMNFNNVPECQKKDSKN